MSEPYYNAMFRIGQYREYAGLSQLSQQALHPRGKCKKRLSLYPLLLLAIPILISSELLKFSKTVRILLSRF